MGIICPGRNRFFNLPSYNNTCLPLRLARPAFGLSRAGRPRGHVLPHPCPACSLRWGRRSHGGLAETGPLAPPRWGGPAPPALPAPSSGRPEVAARRLLSSRRSRRARRRVSARPLSQPACSAAVPRGRGRGRGPGPTCALFTLSSLLQGQASPGLVSRSSPGGLG